MNQILLTEDRKNDDKKKVSKNNNNNPIDLKKIIIFFGIAIIVFGIVLVGFYAINGSNKNKEPDPVDQPVNNTKPELVLEEKVIEGSEEEKNEKKEVKITASSSVGINKIIYIWNSDAETEKILNGETNKEIVLNIPSGSNQLYVKVIDMNGLETEDTQTFVVHNDKQGPTIEVKLVQKDGVDKIKIIAESDIPMKYIKYAWENDDEITVEPETSDDNRIEETIDIKIGRNKIKVIAVDYNNNKIEEEKDIYTRVKPKITVSRNNEKLYMKITHDKGIKSVDFTINDLSFRYDENSRNYSPDRTELEYYFTLKEGENIVTISATSIDGAVSDEFNGRCEYNPEQ